MTAVWCVIVAAAYATGIGIGIKVERERRWLNRDAEPEQTADPFVESLADMAREHHALSTDNGVMRWLR